MFSDENISKTEIYDPYMKYGECRCCMAKGNHRDVFKEYHYNNIREVYKDIFMECFNFPLSTHKHISPLICSNCVQRLRDATSFRMMVASTERQLLDAASANDDMATLFVGVPDPASLVENFDTEIKVEFDCEGIDMGLNMDIFGDGSQHNYSKEDGSKEYTHKYNVKKSRVKRYAESEESSDFKSSDDRDSDYTTCTKDEPLEVIEGESELLSRFPKTLRPLPKRSDLLTICPEYDEHLMKLKHKLVKPKSIEWFFNQPAPKDKIEYISEKLALAINTTTLFEHSNATAFKTKMRSGYPCFYCREIFKYDTLKEHQNIHSKSSIYKLLTKYTADEFIVYADITDLKCTICNENVKNLNELKSHLMEKHDKKIYLNQPDRVIPFKLKETDFECQICGQEQFVTFGAVERHMNKHYGNFICEECGAGFITKHRLGVHASMLHRQGDFTCKVCKKFFPTQHKYRIHYDGVHRMLKKNKCPKCTEKFIDYFTRAKHLVDVHGEEPILYKCNICERGFNRKFSLSSHIKRCHLEQRDIKCQFCSYTCYTKTELKDHMVKHNGIRPYVCCICKKSYGRNKALLLHMRIHNNDRRYNCLECGLSFVQKGSLKGHMKSHQIDIS